MTLLPWHEPLATRLRERTRDGRLPHALLLGGAEGWGERQLANWLALHLLGLDERLQAEGMAHPDLRWLVPDGAEIKVDAVRDLAAFAVGTPQIARRKMAVIMNAEALNRNAANALLKTLEEPPAGTYLVLVSCHPGRLLPTIRSRCQKLLIERNAALGRRWLAEQLPGEELERRLFEHGGAPVAVAEGFARGEQPLEAPLARALTDDGGWTQAQALLEQGLVGVTGRWYRYLVALASGQQRLQALGPGPARRLAQFADELLWVRRQLVTSNSANERLLAERLLASWRGLAV